MAGTDKLIVCVAPTSNFQGKDANPALPYSPQEVAEAVHECWNEGASIVHIHGRDKAGLPTNDSSFFQEVDNLIRERKCDIIIQHSMAPANPMLLGTESVDVDDGLRTTQVTPPPEMASLEVGPCTIVWRGKAIPFPWNRLWAEKAAQQLRQNGIKPEIEIYNNSHMDDLQYLIDKGALTKPHWIGFVLGMHRVNDGAVRYSPKVLMDYVQSLPPDSLFTTLGIGEDEFPATTQSILLGGHVRVGFEDNLNIKRGVLAKSNAELVAKIVRIGRELGREPATPGEARAVLGIPQL